MPPVMTVSLSTPGTSIVARAAPPLSPGARPHRAAPDPKLDLALNGHPELLEKAPHGQVERPLRPRRSLYTPKRPGLPPRLPWCHQPEQGPSALRPDVEAFRLGEADALSQYVLSLLGTLSQHEHLAQADARECL